MSDTVIRVENLGKRYIIGHQQQEKYTALRDVLANTAKGITQRFNPKSKIQNPNLEEFWALKDVSFEVKRGDRIGIIGRNGAGKSTLLKILSRITEPTEGRISIKGRVASLLEVGTGFHPELTGRENIFLNGAILGMSRVEIKKKFDEIVAFAEVERFLDTPVKRYSSGMYVRLAFAVAAHLEPEILVVDEVLAVGDAAFQKKCLGKMEDVSKEGRTILFVSHSMAVVTSLCQEAIWLMNGEIHMQGKTDYVTSKYLTHGAEYSGDVDITSLPSNSHQSRYFGFKRLTLLNSKTQIKASFDVKEPIRIRLEYHLKRLIQGLEIALRIINSAGVSIFMSNRSLYLSSDIEAGYYASEIELPFLFLVPGVYSITISAHIPNIERFARHDHIASFEVVETGSPMAHFQGKDIGVIFVDFPWREKILHLAN